MIDNTDPAKTNNRTKTILTYAGQSAFFALMALIAFGFVQQFPQASIPTAPTEVYFVAYGLFLLVALLHFPVAFFRFPIRLKRIVYASALVSFIFLVSMSVIVVQAYQQTPEGKKAAASAIAWEKEYAEIKAQNKEQDAAFNELVKQAEGEQENMEAVGDCFSFIGHSLPDLESRVQESLNDPASFEHVETSAMSPDYEGNNVQMKFRAKNALGGVITSYAYAKINESCVIENITFPK